MAPKADLELCMIWPWQLKRSMVLQTIDIVKCQPDEKCTQVPDTKIYGLNFGRCQLKSENPEPLPDSISEPTPPIQVKTTTKRNCGFAGGNSSEEKVKDVLDDCNDGFAGPNPEEYYSKDWGTIDKDGKEKIRNSFKKV